MKFLKNMQFLLVLTLWSANCLAQSALQFVNIEDFTTTEGKAMANCSKKGCGRDEEVG